MCSFLIRNGECQWQIIVAVVTGSKTALLCIPTESLVVKHTLCLQGCSLKHSLVVSSSTAMQILNKVSQGRNFSNYYNAIRGIREVSSLTYTQALNTVQ